MADMEKMNKYVKIAERAEKSGMYVMDRLSVLMDIESADLRFNIRLDDWLNADDENFFHDFTGIVTNIERTKFPATEFNLFVPRFAGEE